MIEQRTPAIVSPEDTPLFDGYEPPESPTLDPSLSAGQRLTLRQAQDIATGVHPLTRGPLHPLASRERNASAPKADPFTCGSCWFRGGQHHHDYTYPKCYHPGNLSADEWETKGPPRVTRGAASDVRAWWPACTDYSPGSSLSPDAARSIPEER